MTANEIYKTPLIFLDIDGVITNAHEIPGGWIAQPPENYGISNTNFSFLMLLTELTNAKVIISSNWRKFNIDGACLINGQLYSSPMKTVIDMLGDVYMGCLPPIRHVPKVAALRAWFKEMNVDHTKCKYVIFDDDKDEGFAGSEFNDHYIETDCYTGLSKVNATSAFIMLS